MFFNEETFQAAIVAAINSTGRVEDVSSVIKETVDALIAADRKLSAYNNEAFNTTSESQKQDSDIGS